MLNLKRCSFLISFHLIGISTLMAQNDPNPTVENQNNGDFVQVGITEQPEATVTINQDPKIQTLLAIKSKMEKDGDFSDRYKVQLYNGNLNKANEILRKAKETFPQWDASIRWETPNYKVWIGNYKTKLEKDKALREIRKEFPSAFEFIPGKQKAPVNK